MYFSGAEKMWALCFTRAKDEMRKLRKIVSVGSVLYLEMQKSVGNVLYLRIPKNVGILLYLRPYEFTPGQQVQPETIHVHRTISILQPRAALPSAAYRVSVPIAKKGKNCSEGIQSEA